MSAEPRNLRPSQQATSQTLRHTPAAVTNPKPQHTDQDADTNDSQSRKRLITPARVIFVITVALLIFGYRFPTERYISAESGVGYVLGIVGGSSMLVLLLYPLRKRSRWLAFMGTTKHWFQAHMLLGIAGPVMILYHSNFSLGATNSNVALVCMLVVSGSGLFGRHFYTRIHNGLYGSKASLTELQSQAQRLRGLATGVSLLPELVARIDLEEASLISRCEAMPILLRPAVAPWHTMRARVRLYMYVRRCLRQLKTKLSREQQDRFYQSTSTYIDHRLTATRRVVEFDAYERLFSLWHMLHLPLFFMLLIAGIVHVIAVHVY